MVQASYQVALYVNYQINKIAIAQNFCENKGKPYLHCEGKCHLQKQQQRADSTESKGRTARNINQDANQLYAHDWLIFSPFRHDQSDFCYNQVAPNQYLFQHISATFRPPSA